MSLLSGHLGACADVPLVLSETCELTRSQVNATARALSAHARSRQTPALVIAAPDAGPLFAALVAAEQARIPIVLAHSTLPRDKLHALCRRLGVPEHLDESLTWTPTEGTADTATVESDFTVALMTSGTTGSPKLVRHRIESLLGRIPAMAGSVNRGQRWLLTYQATAFAGLQVLLTALVTAGTVVQSRGRSPADLFAAAERFGVTHISGTPTFWRSFLLAAPAGVPLPLRQITLGGEAVDQTTLDRLATRFPQSRLTHIYASSEAGALFSVQDGRAGFPSAWLHSEASGVGLRIRDGMLEVKSPRRMLGYLGDAAAAVTDDGWLVTGDLVRLDGDRVFFQGRIDDVLNVGGGKVHPQEVEDFLLSCSGVVEARVRGVPNPISGVALVADVVLEAGEEPEARRRHLLRLCQAELPAYKAPRIIRVVDAIATLSSGKKA